MDGPRTAQGATEPTVSRCASFGIAAQIVHSTPEGNPSWNLGAAIGVPSAQASTLLTRGWRGGGGKRVERETRVPLPCSDFREQAVLGRKFPEGSQLPSWAYLIAHRVPDWLINSDSYPATLSPRKLDQGRQIVSQLQLRSLQRTRQLMNGCWGRFSGHKFRR